VARIEVITENKNIYRLYNEKVEKYELKEDGIFRTKYFLDDVLVDKGKVYVKAEMQKVIEQSSECITVESSLPKTVAEKCLGTYYPEYICSGADLLVVRYAVEGTNRIEQKKFAKVEDYVEPSIITELCFDLATKSVIHILENSPFRTGLNELIINEDPFTGVKGNSGIIHGTRIFYSDSKYIMLDPFIPKMYYMSEATFSNLMSMAYCTNRRVVYCLGSVTSFPTQEPLKNLSDFFMELDYTNLDGTRGDYLVEYKGKLYTKFFSYSIDCKRKLLNPLFQKLLENQQLFFGPSFYLKKLNLDYDFEFVKVVRLIGPRLSTTFLGNIVDNKVFVIGKKDNELYQVISTGVKPLGFDLVSSPNELKIITK